MVIVFLWKTYRTWVMQAHLSITRLYIGAYPLHRTLYCNKGLLLPILVEYFTKEMLISPISFA